MSDEVNKLVGECLQGFPKSLRSRVQLEHAIPIISHVRDLEWMGKLIDAGVPVMDSPADIPENLYTEAVYNHAIAEARKAVEEERDEYWRQKTQRQGFIWQKQIEDAKQAVAEEIFGRITAYLQDRQHRSFVMSMIRWIVEIEKEYTGKGGNQ